MAMEHNNLLWSLTSESKPIYGSIIIVIFNDKEMIFFIYSGTTKNYGHKTIY